jgi:hypothetical protein
MSLSFATSTYITSSSRILNVARIARVTQDAIVDAEGTERKVDVIVRLSHCIKYR